MKEEVKKYKVILQEDDCAPDARHYFNEQFFKYFGETLESFIAGISPQDLGDTFVYLKGNYRLENEIGNWTVYELQK